MFLQQESQDLDLLLLQGLHCLALLSLHLSILYNNLVVRSFPRLHFIVFFLQVLWSKFAILFKFFSKKTNHFWNTPSTMFLSPVSLSFCSSRFFVFPNLFIGFFSFLELSFFRFRYRLSFLSICFGSTFTFFKSLYNVFRKLLIFRELCTP